MCKFNYDMHIEYWTNKKYYINYLMTDHMFDIAYKERSKIRDMIDSVHCGNKKCLTINRVYDQPVNRSEAEAFWKNNICINYPGNGGDEIRMQGLF